MSTLYDMLECVDAWNCVDLCLGSADKSDGYDVTIPANATIHIKKHRMGLITIVPKERSDGCPTLTSHG